MKKTIGFLNALVTHSGYIGGTINSQTTSNLNSTFTGGTKILKPRESLCGSRQVPVHAYLFYVQNVAGLFDPADCENL